MIELIKKIVLQPEITANVVGFEITSVVDNPMNKTITANVNLISYTGEKIDRSGLLLWAGDDYTAAGQWTDDDAANRINELLTNN